MDPTAVAPPRKAPPAAPAPAPNDGAAKAELYDDVLHRHIAKLERLSDLAMAVSESIAADITQARRAKGRPDLTPTPALSPVEGAAPTLAEDLAAEAADLASDAAETAPRRAPASRDLALQFARVSRAARLTIALQARLIGELRAAADPSAAGAAGAAGAGAARLAPQPTLSPAEDRRLTLEKIVKTVAEAEHPEARETVERLVGEARERLDEREDFEGLLARPVSEIIAEICRDLGLSPNWPRLADKAWDAEAKAWSAFAQGGGQTIRLAFVDAKSAAPRAGSRQDRRAQDAAPDHGGRDDRGPDDGPPAPSPPVFTPPPAGPPPAPAASTDAYPDLYRIGPDGRRPGQSPHPLAAPWPPPREAPLGLPGEYPPPRRPRR